MVLGLRLLCKVELADCTVEARGGRRVKSFDRKFSDLCELRVSMVNTF
jgi:hypothetical protein